MARDVDVTIVICTRNRAEQLAAMLASLSQIRSNSTWEAIIVDNGSTDSTKSVIEAAACADRRLNYVFEPEQGLGAARDTGTRLASGRIVALTDDDCYPAQDYVEAIRLPFVEDPDLGFVGGRICLYDPADYPITIDERDFPVELKPRTFAKAGAVQGANIAFRRDVLKQAGGFDRGLGAGTPFPCEDIDAVSAVLWSGFKGRYDPRPTVFHHHGRKAADLAALRESYDRGRGAYFAKYILRADSRRAFAVAWLNATLEQPRRRALQRAANELKSAATFVAARGSFVQRATIGTAMTVLRIAILAAIRVKQGRASTSRTIQETLQ